ncbi:MAG TPA: enoyl-CoA hydratase/isomerase family protein [Ignavibacteriaceae bacterium]|nr:enoyl-CoA hydratase/isomerase family protein [Ignavibacteriaceae bacterium]
MITKEIINNSLLITLNRPEKRNSLHPEIVAELKSAFAESADNDEIKSIILTGAGSSFCAGADLDYLKQLSNNSVIENEKDSESLAELFFQIYNFTKPTIAAVNGAAIAGGCGLASVCDFIVAHPEESKFGYSEVIIGFIPAIVSVFLLRRISISHAKQMLLTGEIISGKRAYEISLANYLSDNVLDEAKRVAATINKNSALSTGITKKMIYSISDMNPDTAIDFCVNLNVISRTSDEFKKGIQKFLNKE